MIQLGSCLLAAKHTMHCTSSAIAAVALCVCVWRRGVSVDVGADFFFCMSVWMLVWMIDLT